MKEFKLHDGNVVLIDDEDLHWLQRFKWRVAPNGYVYCTIYLHRLLMAAPRTLEVDHDDTNKLNNQKQNLKVVTHSQNCLKSWRHRYSAGRCTFKKRAHSSKYRGVSRFRGKWRANINVEGRRVYLGVFDNETDAAREFNAASRQHFGADAFQNDV